MAACVFVWCKTTEEWLPFSILATVKTSMTSILVWGLMFYNGVDPLIAHSWTKGCPLACIKG